MNKEKCRILASGETADNDTRRTGLNNNDLVIGPSGAGKSRGYVLPNIMQCNESIIVSDSKNSLWHKTEKLLRQAGYQVFCLDLRDCEKSCGYNPLDYIGFDPDSGRYREQDIMTIAAVLSPVTIKHDPFWELAARTVLECLIAYTLECLPLEEHTLSSVVTLFQEISAGYFQLLIKELEELDPDSFALQRWQMFRTMAAADRTTASVMGILTEKLAPLAFHGTETMFTRTDRIRIADIGRRKTAVFVNVSDTDRSLDRMVSLFYTQVLQELCNQADRMPDGRLEMPVRLILDDFAANVSIPDFDKIISVIRSREISVSIILQSISQLEDIYGLQKAMTIINNCDSLLYLGGLDVQTASYIAVKANKAASTILNMPLDQAQLFIRGSSPRVVGKYRLETHARYAELEGE